MSDMPADILLSAKKCHDEIQAQSKGRGLTAFDGVHIIARWLNDERERCAKIADQSDPEKQSSYLFKRERIAAAIRSPSLTNKET